VDGFGSSGRGREVQGNPDGTGPAQGPHRVDASALGPLQSLAPFRPELAYQSQLRKRDDLLQGGDTETFQPLDHERIHGKNGNGTGGEEGGKAGVVDQDRLSGFGPGRRYPGSEFSRGPAHTSGRYKGPGKYLQEGLKGDPYLMGRGAVKALQTVHSHEDSPAAGGLHHRAQPHEGFHHLLLSRVVVGWIGLQKGQRGAEGDGLGDQLARPDPGFCPSLRNLPQRSSGALSR
jgi:hypothetical protein